jgi:MFS superfamily sulfate permease-like transporter
LYFNVDHVLEVVLTRARVEQGVRRVICDLSNTPYADIAGARILRRMHQELATMSIEFKIAEAHGPVREILRAEGLEPLVGSITRHTNLAEVIEQS